MTDEELKAENKRLREALGNLILWHDRDGSVGGLCDPIENARARLKGDKP